MKNLFKSPIVILANGKFPEHKIPLEILYSSGTLICADGSINHLVDLKLEPHILIGDLDSVKNLDTFKGLLISDSNQNNSDIEKCIDWSIKNGIQEVVVIGATGFREDMTVNNIMLLYRYYKKIDIRIVSDHFTITCNIGKNSFSSFKGQKVSLMPKSRASKIQTTNLKYSLNGNIDDFTNLCSNESMGDTFEIQSKSPVIVFSGHLEV